MITNKQVDELFECNDEELLANDNFRDMREAAMNLARIAVHYVKGADLIECLGHVSCALEAGTRDLKEEKVQ